MVVFSKHEELDRELTAIKEQPLSQAACRQLVSLMDLTSLNEGDTEESIAALCRKAESAAGRVAALCVYPRFVKQVAAFLNGRPIQVATVANFPQGSASLPEVLREIEGSLQAGAQEIDVVFPYAAYLRGDRAVAITLVSQCKRLCAQAPLKVILETSALGEPELIAQAAEDVLQAGADFIKTSTGKLAQGGASLNAAAAMLLTIKKCAPLLKRPLGFKAAGFIRTPEEALRYLALAKSILGPTWPTPHSFRLGGSQLLEKLEAEILK